MCQTHVRLTGVGAIHPWLVGRGYDGGMDTHFSFLSPEASTQLDSLLEPELYAEFQLPMVVLPDDLLPGLIRDGDAVRRSLEVLRRG